MGLTPSPHPAPDDLPHVPSCNSAGSLMKRQSPVFTRVQSTAPMFTFNLPELFVNVKSAISTDIYRFLADMFPFRPVFTGFLRRQVKIAASVPTWNAPSSTHLRP